jgi:ABC-2 type transport system ATP-binding protein
VIEIQNLFEYYGSKRVLGPISATIQEGEIVGLLGLNGAGKTTTLRILACDLLPSSGSVKIDGVDVVEHPEQVRARIGYLPDRPPLYDEMTVDEFLRFVARLRGLSKDGLSQRVGEVLDSTGLSGVQHDPIGSLSHGFRQRVGIAQAIVHRPKLVVLDEPISGLDPVQIVEMRDLVRRLAGEHTVLVSSHILGEISETCDRILVVGDGKIVASGSEAELTAELSGSNRVTLTVRCPVAGRARLE